MSAVLAGHELIADERARQVSGEGWTSAHDDAHDTGELARAAACYLHTVAGAPASAPDWPWDRSSWKPSGGAIRNLVKAGALIAAEIDRLQGTAPAASLPVEPAGTPEGTVSERFHQYLHDLLRAYAKSRSLPIGSGQAANEAGTALSLALVRVKNLFAEATTSAYTVTEATRALRAENTELSDRCAALTSEVSRLQKNWDEAYEVHESDKIEIIDLRAEVSALREAVDKVLAEYDEDWLDINPDITAAERESVVASLTALRAARRDGAP